VATIIEVPCHRYSGKELLARLTIEPGTVFCPIRCGHYSLTPEEHVRQALVWFLVEGAASAATWRNQLRIEVEKSSLDVSAFHGAERAEARFMPPMPVVVFETKRIERDSDDDAATDKQLQDYMVRERCREGFVFNGRQAAWLTLAGEFTAPAWTKTPIADLLDAENRINQAASVVANQVEAFEAIFAQTTIGDFDSVMKLVEVFGGNAGLTFFLSVRSDGYPGLVRAFSLKISDPELITYRARGTGGKRRLQLTRQNFHALRSIEPVG
jgi:hypothetical protein